MDKRPRAACAWQSAVDRLQSGPPHAARAKRYICGNASQILASGTTGDNRLNKSAPYGERRRYAVGFTTVIGVWRASG